MDPYTQTYTYMHSHTDTHACTKHVHAPTRMCTHTYTCSTPHVIALHRCAFYEREASPSTSKGGRLAGTSRASGVRAHGHAHTQALPFSRAGRMVTCCRSEHRGPPPGTRCRGPGAGRRGLGARGGAACSAQGPCLSTRTDPPTLSCHAGRASARHMPLRAQDAGVGCRGARGPGAGAEGSSPAPWAWAGFGPAGARAPAAAPFRTPSSTGDSGAVGVHYRDHELLEVI